MSDAFERLLRSTRRDAAPADACPDAEALAAYLDGGLSRTERDTVERHASQCERCALTMAAVVRLEDAAGIPARHAVADGHWWRPWAWAVPAATAVLVAVIWTALPRQPYEDDPERTSAVGEAPASPAAPEPSGASEPGTVAPSDRVEEAPPAPPTLADADTAAPKGGPRAAAPQATAPGAPVERQQGVPVHDTAETRAFAAPQAAADAARESATPPAAAAGQTAAAPSDLAGAAGAARNENAGSAPLAAEKAAAAPPAPSAPAPARRASAAPEPLVVWSPARRSAWRTVGGRIERSVDGGTTWTADGTITSSRRVLAGAAMSEDVCWLVGEHGLVWRRTAEGWRQAESPTTDPLIEVTARSAAEATVVTGAGVRFTTGDGGATWR